MKLISSAIECNFYMILEHPDADGSTTFSQEAVDATTSLRCSFLSELLEQRDKTQKVDETLLAAASEACEGENKRWRLMNIGIREDRLILAFADLETKLSNNSYAGSCICLNAMSAAFHVEVMRVGSRQPDKYDIELYAEDAGLDDDGKYLIADINEHRNGKWRAVEHLVRHHDGKYYLEQYLFD